MSEQPMPLPNDITRGRGPCQLWHFIGMYVIAPFKVRPDMLHTVQLDISTSDRQLAAQHMVAVMEASKAINRMMGRPEMYGSGREARQ